LEGDGEIVELAIVLDKAFSDKLRLWYGER
jgi:hypothetical protein